ncbi:unnamed protein product [Laminaria digitata]
MEVSSHTLSATSCFVAVKLTFNRTRAANNSKSSKRSKGRLPSQTQGGSSGAGKGSTLGINEVAFKSLILGALESLHGELGSVGYLVDVLSWDPVSGEGRLRVNARSLVPIRAALSLVGSYGNTPCAINVTAASPFLAGLACERYL